MTASVVGAFARDAKAENDAEVRTVLDRYLSRRGAAREMATFTGLSEAYISQVRKGSRPVPPKLAFALGYRRVVVWKPIVE